jgi:hypothetical protein
MRTTPDRERRREMKKAAIIIIAVVVVAAGVSTALILRGWAGNLETKEYAFTDFTAVEISGPSEFEISQSNSYSVNVSVQKNVADRLRVSQDGQTLTIRLDVSRFPLLGSIRPLKVLVTMPQLRGLTVSAASRGTISGFSSPEDLDITVSGASRVTGDITAGNAGFGISGASTIELEGAAEDMVAEVSGASRFNLEDFTVDNADVNISGASTGTINLTGRLDANVSGASTLLYIGEPTMGDISVTGASTLRQK